jgi:hypothetical protein
MNAWGTLVLIDGISTLVSAANGGHTDSNDNRVASINLAQNAPAWSVQISASASFTANAAYNPDGKPGSRHGYAYAQYISQRSRVMLFGARGRATDGGDNYAVDGHTVSGTWAWDAAGTYTSLAAGRGWGACRDPNTGNVWTAAGWLWDQASNTWSQPLTFSTTWRYPVAYDSARGQFFTLQWGDGGPDGASTGTVATKFDRSTGAQTSITFNASSAYTQWQADGIRYGGMDYDSANDCFLFYAGQTFTGGSVASNVTQRVYKVTPNSGSTWDMSILTVTGVTPDAAPGSAGINGRWRYVPTLGGFFLQPTQTSNGFFLRTS